MALVYLHKTVLFLKVVGYTFGLLVDGVKRGIATRRLTADQTRLIKGVDSDARPRQVVIIGASFAGYHVARLVALSIPTDGSWNIVIVEPNAHYQFTWTLPRFCVVEGHEDKTFIPYGPYIPEQARHIVKWVHQSASEVTREAVIISETGEEIPYDFLVVATGAGVGLQLPSRVGSGNKKTGVQLMQKMQQNIKSANKLVVIGGGAAGVELATDAKNLYPQKHVILVHSRPALMHRFGPELQAAALKGMLDLKVEVLLEERAVNQDDEAGLLTLKSGRVIEYDLCVNCGGQKPSSEIIRTIAQAAISEHGHIKVKPSLQIDEPSLPNVYACGDVADTGVQTPNARSAMKQAQYVADNIVLAIQGQEPSNFYTPEWADAGIKLTLGLHKSVTNVSDGTTELLFHAKDKGETLMIKRAWTHMGATPYQDNTPEQA